MLRFSGLPRQQPPTMSPLPQIPDVHVPDPQRFHGKCTLELTGKFRRGAHGEKSCSLTVISVLPPPAFPCSSLRANLCTVEPTPSSFPPFLVPFPFLTISSWLEEAYFMFNLKWVRSDVSGCQVESSGNLKLILILRLYVKFNEQNLQGGT